MGADIHMYPEHRAAGDGRWQSLGGRINPGRDYNLFSKIANVRGREAMFPVRGFPKDAGYTARGDNHRFIHEAGGEGCVTPAVAERWVADGHSRYTDETKKWVTDPDWHSHTWLAPAELRKVLEAPRERWPVDVDYWAVLAMVEECERRGREARLVIWFDN